MTNKIVTRSADEFMADYKNVYQPIYPLLLQKSQQYPSEVGELSFRRVQAVGDIRGHRITPKDTEIRQIAVMEGKKTFKKYFLANQFIQSRIQNQEGLEEVVTQVLDEHQAQADELLLFGEGTNSGNVVNNGLYHSADANYLLESSKQVASSNRLFDFQAKVAATVEDANSVAGQKLVLFYGEDVSTFVNSLFPESAKAVRTALAESMPGVGFAKIPKLVTPAGANGWIVVNRDQVKTHYTALPALLDQGYNAEKMYYWHNFMLGSMMVEVLAKNGIIHQPVTLEGA